MAESHVVIDFTDKEGNSKKVKLGVNLPNIYKDFCTVKNLTDKPIFLEKGTDGSLGKKGSYVLFGDWPQSLKADDVTVDTNQTYNLNEWECYKGSDNCYYVKQTAQPYIIDDDNKTLIQKFGNGAVVENGTENYFKVEPIKWRVLDNNFSGGKLLLAENVLTAGCFDPHYDSEEQVVTCRTINDVEVYPNDYKYSQIRSYLNGLNGSKYAVENYKNNGFINLAFSENAQNNLKAINLGNGKSTLFGKGDIIMEEYLDEDKNPYKYAGQSTKDKVFLLSEADMTNESYGFFSSDEESESFTRCRKATDYAIAMGADAREEDNKEKNCSWFLRTPFYAFSFGCRQVTVSGNIGGGCCVSFNQYGVVPAVCLLGIEE